jgi:hypothetical protein
MRAGGFFGNLDILQQALIRIQFLLKSPDPKYIFFKNFLEAVHWNVMHDIAICQVTGRLVVASSDVKGCDKSLLQEERVAGNIVLVERGDCMFIEKGRVLQVSYYLKGLCHKMNIFLEGTR